MSGSIPPLARFNPLPYLDRRFTDWLTRPERNAAGNLGLYRILYAFFYLQLAAEGAYSGLANLPEAQWRPVFMLAWLPGIPSALALDMAYDLLVIGLGMLLIGFYTRPATLTVLLAGTFLSATRYSFNNISHGDQYMVMYIPFFMLFVNWGKTYSVDALLRKRRGQATVDVHDGSWRHAWGNRAVLLLLSVMFAMSAYIKYAHGDWLREFTVISNIVYAANLGTAHQPFYDIIANTGWIYAPLEALGFLFEATFPLALLGLSARRFYLSAAVFFHLFNRHFVGPSTYGMLLVYALFVNWQLVYDRYWGRKARLPAAFERLSARSIVVASLVFVGILSLTLNTPFVSRGIFNGVWVTHIIWWVAAPLAAVGLSEVLRLGWNRVLRQPASRSPGIPHLVPRILAAALFLALAYYLVNFTPVSGVYDNWWEFALLLIALYLAIVTPALLGNWPGKRTPQLRLRYTLLLLPVILSLMAAAGWELEPLRHALVRPFSERFFPLYQTRFPMLGELEQLALPDLKHYDGSILISQSEYAGLKNRLDQALLRADIDNRFTLALERWHERRYPGLLDEAGIEYLLVDSNWLRAATESQRTVLDNPEYYELTREWRGVAGETALYLYAVVGDAYPPDHPYYDGRLGGTRNCAIYPHGEWLDVYVLRGSDGVLAAKVTADDLAASPAPGEIVRSDDGTVKILRLADGNLQIECRGESDVETHILADLSGAIVREDDR